MSNPTQHGLPRRTGQQSAADSLSPETRPFPSLSASRELQAAESGETEQSRAQIVVGDRSTPGADSEQVTYQNYLGEEVSSYEILGMLGLGGFGAVFRARHVRLTRMAAVKFLSPEAVKNREIVNRFFIEAKAASDIRHKNIVEVYDVDTHTTLGPYLVMELLEPGVSLSKELGSQTFSEERAIHIVLQLCSALSAAHEKGIVHRDLKPDNIFLVTREGVADIVKVLDFGIAKLLSPEDQVPGMKTSTGVVVGTPYYMSPEQCEGINVDHRTDIYALGCILYQLLARQVPFQGETYGAIFKGHMLTPPPKIRVLRPEISARCEQVILRCLAKDKEKRFGSMAEVARALRGEELPAFGKSELGSIGQWSTEEFPAARRGSSHLWLVFTASLLLCAGLFWGLRSWLVGGQEEFVVASSGVVAATTMAVSTSVPVKQKQWLRSQPTGAEVYEAGTLVGLTPLELEQGIEVTVRKTGYLEKTLRLDGTQTEELVLEAAPVVPTVVKPTETGTEVFVPRQKIPELIVE